jgi:hypothetical protein
LIKATWRGFADLSQNVGNSRHDVGDWANVRAAMVREDGHMAQHAPNSQPAETSPTDVARVNPSAMSVDDAARVLSRIGGQTVTQEMLRADIDAGAPANRDGTINLVNYAAWLVKEMASRGD